MGRRNPHVQGGLATPPPQLDDDEPDEPPAADEPDEPDPDEPDEGDDEGQGDEGPAAAGGRALRVPKPVDTGAGWLLGLLLWGWVVLPFVKGGPAGVKAVWRAKFLNQAADGSELP